MYLRCIAFIEGVVLRFVFMAYGGEIIIKGPVKGTAFVVQKLVCCLIFMIWL